jgi:hypothetical protein
MLHTHMSLSLSQGAIGRTCSGSQSRKSPCPAINLFRAPLWSIREQTGLESDKAVPLHAMEVLGGEKYSSYALSTSALDGGEWSASSPGRAFTARERTLGTHCTGGWMSPRAGLNTEDRGKILHPRRGSNPDRPVVQPVVRHCTDWANPAPRIGQKSRYFWQEFWSLYLRENRTWNSSVSIVS